MKAGGSGGRNTKSGEIFEKLVSLRHLFSAIPGYEIKPIQGKAGSGIFYKRKLVARCFPKYQFYKYLQEEGVDWRLIISKQLIPDDALLVVVRETLFIIEIKYQGRRGSTDEKLQTCDFKRKQYQKLVASLKLKVEYVYVLHEWFRAESYRDTLDYINTMNCHYRFDTPPLAWLGLPSK